MCRTWVCVHLVSLKRTDWVYIIPAWTLNTEHQTVAVLLPMTNLWVLSSALRTKGSSRCGNLTLDTISTIKLDMRVSYLFKNWAEKHILSHTHPTHTHAAQEGNGRTKEHVHTYTRTIYGTYNLKEIASLFVLAHIFYMSRNCGAPCTAQDCQQCEFKFISTRSHGADGSILFIAISMPPPPQRSQAHSLQGVRGVHISVYFEVYFYFIAANWLNKIHNKNCSANMSHKWGFIGFRTRNTYNCKWFLFCLDRTK